MALHTLAGVALLGMPFHATIAQSPNASANATKTEFEAATIKPGHPGPDGPPVGVQIYPDRVVIHALSLKRLICAAFNIELWQMQGGEGWTENDLFDIEAKPQQTSESNPYSLNHSNVTIGDPRLRQMMQALLTERFQLRWHPDTKIGTISILEKSSKPLSLRPSKAYNETEHRYPLGFSGTIGKTPAGWAISKTSMPQLAAFLGAVVRHPVVDKTGLDGSYDFRSAVALTAEDFQSGMDSFLPVVGEMGLKLTSSKGPVETFVIDHVEHPSAN